MKRRWVRVLIITAAVALGLYLLGRSTGWMLCEREELSVEVTPATVLREYPELEITEERKAWLDEVFRQEMVQTLLSERGEVEFPLADLGLDRFPGLSEDGTVSVRVDGTAFDDVLIEFEPVIRDGKLLQFAFSLSLGENGAPKYTGMLSVYRFRGEADTDFRALLAGYYNFDGSFSGYVPGIAFVWGDMLIFETPYPRAERLE